eukprot:CAMPEP_0173374608 /NCGR_PEP_ID=MMETSP1144-20121109/29164_1 /TAXON_ID=483371 /ORGANISM="non described non described, Strain CCMP2298" /LENGTH=59 /DNA_ID=CAMNT_0014326945 /DNA_START=365 /DNA_END=544 /DNA_ORIENTATION=+
MGPATAPEICADCPLRAPLCCALSTTPDQEEEDEGEGRRKDTAAQEAAAHLRTELGVAS